MEEKKNPRVKGNELCIALMDITLDETSKLNEKQRNKFKLIIKLLKMIISVYSKIKLTEFENANYRRLFFCLVTLGMETSKDKFFKKLFREGKSFLNFLGVFQLGKDYNSQDKELKVSAVLSQFWASLQVTFGLHGAAGAAFIKVLTQFINLFDDVMDFQADLVRRTLQPMTFSLGDDDKDKITYFSCAGMESLLSDVYREEIVYKIMRHLKTTELIALHQDSDEYFFQIKVWFDAVDKAVLLRGPGSEKSSRAIFGLWTSSAPSHHSRV